MHPENGLTPSFPPSPPSEPEQHHHHPSPPLSPSSFLTPHHAIINTPTAVTPTPLSTTPSTPSTPIPIPTPHRRRKGKFTDLVFTHSFSTFDRQNPSAANSPFHGFFTLFWMGVFLFAVKIGADNWRRHGNPLGTNEIMRGMLGRELAVLLAADGVMCALTGVGWVFQLMVRRGWMDWDGWGWVVQNVSFCPCCFAGLGLLLKGRKC